MGVDLLPSPTVCVRCPRCPFGDGCSPEWFDLVSSPGRYESSYRAPWQVCAIFHRLENAEDGVA